MTTDQNYMDNIRAIAENQPPFAAFFGLRIMNVTSDLVEAEFTVAPAMINRNGVLHGGAISAICDNMGGTATFMTLAPGTATTTIEAKTNFFRSVPLGETVTVKTIPLHRGRRTAVWQTTLYRADRKVAAISVQTQMIMQGE